MKKKPPNLPKKIAILLVIWGDLFWERFLNYNLVSRMTDGNFIALSQAFDLEYKIYSPQEDLNVYCKSDNFKWLSSTIKTDIFPIEVDPTKSRYTLFSDIHKSILEQSTPDTAYIFDFPDLFYSNNLFSNIIPLIQSEKRLITLPGLRLNLQGFYGDPLFQNKISGNLRYTNEDYLKVCLRNLHSNVTLNLFKEKKYVLETLSWLCWRQSKNSFFVQGFHFHPLYVWPEKNVPLNCQTIDQGEYLYKACPKKKSHYFCSGKNFYYFELSDESRSEHEINQRPTMLPHLFWSKQFAHPIQRSYFGKRKFFSEEKRKLHPLKEIQWASFVLGYHLLNLLPSFLIKPLLFSTYKKVSQNNKISLFFYLKNCFIPNYYEKLLLQSYLGHDHSHADVISYTRDNIKKITPECLSIVFWDFYNQSESDAFSLLDSLKHSRKKTALLNSIVLESIKGEKRALLMKLKSKHQKYFLNNKALKKSEIFLETCR